MPMDRATRLVRFRMAGTSISDNVAARLAFRHNVLELSVVLPSPSEDMIARFD